MSNRGQYDHNWRKIRMTILQRDGHICAYCGQQADTVDHIVPLNKGGTNDPDNLTAACNRCNGAKSDKQGSFFLGPRAPHAPSSFSPLRAEMTRLKPRGAFFKTIGDDSGGIGTD
jgi:5-methylcytosine-specific restriction endonuclease McrA